MQLPEAKGVTALPLECHAEPPAVAKAASVVRNPVRVQRMAEQSWRLGNGLLTLELDPRGLTRLQDQQGVDQLSAPLQFRRYRDQGEFWDAWDLAADYPQQQLPMAAEWQVELVEQGPLVARIVLRSSIESSAVRMDVLMRADRPAVELQVTINWRQTHELLRMVCPLVRPAVRWAADTSGGVIERPAVALTPWEHARWELPVISWLASEEAASGGGLGVLLDGPQGVDAGPHHLGVSLLRGPTWPDPSADQRLHRHRIALMPVSRGWYRDGLAQAAIQFREPGWLGPIERCDRWQGFPALPAPLVPVSIREDQAAGAVKGSVLLQLLNPGSARVNWSPGDEGWWIQDQQPSTVISPGALQELRLTPQSS